MTPAESKEKEFVDALQILRTRAEPPPFQAFGQLIPRAPSSHRPRFRTFGEVISPRILDGVGGYIGNPASTAMKYTMSTKKMRKTASNSARALGSAVSAVPFNPPVEQDADSSDKKKGRREEFSFRRSGWAPARIDVSEQAIRTVAQKDSTEKAKIDLRFVFDMIDSITNDGIITEADLTHCFKRLQYEAEAGEIKDIIWEVDDDHDGGINWKEFEKMYRRVRNDEYGHEPRRFYMLVEFLTFDLDADGTVSLNDALELFYRRYGKKGLFTKTGSRSKLKIPTSGVSVSFTEYVKFDFDFYSISRQLADASKKRSQNHENEAKRMQSQMRPPRKAAANTGNPEGQRRQRSGLREALLDAGGLEAAIRAMAHPQTIEMQAMSPRRTLSIPSRNPTPRRRKPTKMQTALAQLKSFADSPRAKNCSVITHGISAIQAESDVTHRRPLRMNAKEGLRRQQETINARVAGERPRRGSEVLYSFHGLIAGKETDPQ